LGISVILGENLLGIGKRVRVQSGYARWGNYEGTFPLNQKKKIIEYQEIDFYLFYLVDKN